MPSTPLVEPSTVAFAGDWHGNGRWAQEAIRHAAKLGADAIVHLGDFGWWVEGAQTHQYLECVARTLAEFGLPLYWVDGNHEDHGRIAGALEVSGGQPWSDERYPNIVHLPRGFRWDWHGKTWLAMGGAHSVDRVARIPGKSWWDAEHISDEEIDRAIGGGRVDILVSHDCPGGVPIPGIGDDDVDPYVEGTAKGFPPSEIIAAREHRDRLRRVCDAVRPWVIFHGHYHWMYRDVLRYPDGGLTAVFGLADDSSRSLSGNVRIVRIVQGVE